VISLKLKWPPTKELLIQLVIEERKTDKEISKLFNKSPSSIRKYLVKYSIRREKVPVITAEQLHQKYVIEGLTIEEIGKLIKRSVETVRYYLKKYNIPTRRRGPKYKYSKIPFSGNLSEKAYLIGIKSGDFYAYREYNCVVVSVTTTHPAMLKLFKELFSRYGMVKFRPIFSNSKGYEWGAYCRLDSSFKFLLWRKEKGIPKWIKDNHEYFINFLSGYFDAEGHISITKNGAATTCRLRCQINSKDFKILEDIHKKLNSFYIPSKIRNCKSGEIWRLEINKRNDVITFLKLMRLRHEEKIMERSLAFYAYNNSWKECFPKLKALKSLIKENVKKCISAAEKEFRKREVNENKT
jgi:hypothetical protein